MTVTTISRGLSIVSDGTIGPYEMDSDARRDAKSLVVQYGVPIGQEDWRWAKEALLAVTINRCGVEFGAFDLATMELLAGVCTMEQCQAIVGWIVRASGDITPADETMIEIIKCPDCSHTPYNCNVTGCSGRKKPGWRGWPAAGVPTQREPVQLVDLDAIAAKLGEKDLPNPPRTVEAQ
jgi:hypothetical protein